MFLTFLLLSCFSYAMLFLRGAVLAGVTSFSMKPAGVCFPPRPFSRVLSRLRKFPSGNGAVCERILQPRTLNPGPVWQRC